MADIPHPKPTLNKLEGGILSLSGPALLDLLRAVLNKRVPFRFCARGFSMSPFIKDGDVVTVSPCAPHAIRYGDVVAFVNSPSERLAVHRVVGVAQDAWLIKGDNAPEEDGWIPRPCILGRVTRVERRGTRVRLGLGVERAVIAFLSQRAWLYPVLIPIWRLVRPIARRLKP